MGQERWFFRNPDEWNVFAQQLKLTPCPHCKVVGALIRHGFLHGFDESNRTRTLRARRLFCSNRNARPGCGRTFSVWLADKIRRLSLTTAALMRFLQRVVADGIAAAIRGFDCPLCDRTLFRIWQRFRLAQSKIRTTLRGLGRPPQLPTAHRPEAETLAHLQAAFPDAPCPLAAFQQALRTFVI